MSDMNELDKELQQLEAEVATTTPVEEQLPEKYRGKSPAEIVKMHQEAEKLLGQRAKEVGDIRKLADDLIKQQLVNSKGTIKSQPAESTDIDEIDFFANPKSALDKFVSSHPAVKQTREAYEKLQRREALKELATAHPDYKQVAADESFKSWVSKSKYRADLYNKANTSFDFDAANELFSTWKEIHPAKEPVVEEQKEVMEKQLKAASVGSAGNQSKASGKEIFSRRALLELMKTNPQKYQALEPRIALAYDEGRVRD